MSRARIFLSLLSVALVAFGWLAVGPSTASADCSDPSDPTYPCNSGPDCVADNCQEGCSGYQTCDCDAAYCLPSCGDGTCDANEDCDGCPSDCGSCDGFCGDGNCEATLGENTVSCPLDCGACDPCDGAGGCFDPTDPSCGCNFDACELADGDGNCVFSCDVCPEDPSCECEGLEGKDLVCCQAPDSTQCLCYGLYGLEWDCCADPSLPECAQGCAEPCADNYGAEEGSCTYGSSPSEICCDNGIDEDSNGLIDRGFLNPDSGNWENADPACVAGIPCGYDYIYEFTESAVGLKVEAHAELANMPYCDPPPDWLDDYLNLQATERYTAASSIGTFYEYQPSAVQYFSWTLVDKDYCLNLSGYQPSVPEGYERDDETGECAALDCSVDGDDDLDEVCNPEDPCDNFAYEARNDGGDLAAAGIVRDNPGDSPECSCIVAGATYNPATGRCEGDGDFCDNLTGVQATVPAGMVASGDDCACDTASYPDEPKICTDGPDYCIGAEECCSTAYTFCSVTNPPQCILNSDYGSLCTSCSAGIASCCGANPPAWCTQVVDTCFSSPHVVSYCTTIYAADGGNQGTVAPPYTSQGEVSSLFPREWWTNTPPDVQGYRNQTQKNDQTPVPIYGIVEVVESGNGEACSGEYCYYEEACINQTNPATRQVEAVCVPAAQIATTTETTSPDGLTRWVRAAQINVLPALIPSGGQCLVLWSAQGMTSCETVGSGLDVPAGNGRQFAGAELVTPGTGGSATYTITCDAVDGFTYRASDSCSTNPGILEF